MKIINVLSTLVLSTGVLACGTSATEDALTSTSDTLITTTAGQRIHFYSASVSGMPDFDQRRATDLRASVIGLPGAGEMYCGPTSAANVLSYFAQNGYPAVDPGNFDLEPKPLTGSSIDSLTAFFNKFKYEKVTAFIDDLGKSMGTSTDDGTGAEAIRHELASRLPDDFSVTIEGKRGSDGDDDDFVVITPRTIYTHFRRGHIVLARIGFYSDDGTGTGTHIRTGGHWVVPNGVESRPQGTTLDFTDPYRNNNVSDGNRLAQGAFVTEVTRLQRETITMDGTVRIRWRLVDRGSNGYLEQLIVVDPDVVCPSPEKAAGLFTQPALCSKRLIHTPSG